MRSTVSLRSAPDIIIWRSDLGGLPPPTLINEYWSHLPGLRFLQRSHLPGAFIFPSSSTPGYDLRQRSWPGAAWSISIIYPNQRRAGGTAASLNKEKEKVKVGREI